MKRIYCSICDRREVNNVGDKCTQCRKHRIIDKRGGIHLLSKRELEIVAALSEGKSYKEIAYKFVISEGTVKTQVHKLLLATGNTSSAGLVGWYYRFKMAELDKQIMYEMQRGPCA